MSHRPRRGTLWLLILALLAGILLPFLVWGDQFEAALSLEGSRAWMESFGRWAWMAGILLLMADLFLPVPGTVVMSALGWMYGWWWGGWLASIGSLLSGILAYGLCRALGRPAARWLAGEEGLKKAESIFSKHGGWLVALSRWAPVLPEAVACLAGVTRMSWHRFLGALLCGSLPLGFVFAAIGHLGQSHLGWALLLSAILPLGLWIVIGHQLKQRHE